jgi:hypothetical protein
LDLASDSHDDDPFNIEDDSSVEIIEKSVEKIRPALSGCDVGTRFSP